MIEYTVVHEMEDDGRYPVYAPDLPDCACWGMDRAEALDRIREAIEVWIEAARDDGDPVPTRGAALDYVRISG